MVTHSMENILSMQYYAAPPATDEMPHSPPARKKRCLPKEQDPMSHRIIEKRRRDRMNNCLADLSRLIPAEYLKKGRGRVEKTEIIEMAIRHMKHLQSLRPDTKHHAPIHPIHAEDSVDSVSHSPTSNSSAAEHYRLGYQECLSETMHFLVEVEGFFARDSLCVQLVSHLQQHCDKILATSDRLGFPHPMERPPMNGTSCNGVTSFAHAANGSIPSMCPGSNLTTANVGLLNNNSINHNQNHSTSHLLHNNSDRCSSSGVSSFDSSESRPQQRPLLIPAPSLVSDDSNHSNHSHASGLTIPILNGQLNHHSPQQQQDQRPPTNYKFKNSIKQRFSADQRIKTSSSPSPPSATCSSSEASSPKHNDSHQSHQGVPIFALHDNGGFYIPLTLEAAVLKPHMSYVTADVGPDTVLHPVTISVNFNHTTPSTWSHHSPPHQMT